MKSNMIFKKIFVVVKFVFEDSFGQYKYLFYLIA